MRDGKGPNCNVWSNFKQVFVQLLLFLCVSYFSFSCLFGFHSPDHLGLQNLLGVF